MRWNRCVVCEAECNEADPSTRPPACSENCFKLWTIFIGHRGEPCWISGCLEVNCGVSTPGYCCQCDVFKTRKEIEKRGLGDRNIPPESY